jgi:excinuclease ABC subunit A
MLPVTAPAPDSICILGARQHNLKNISVALPRARLTVITGVSGSGKSSLAFDTLYAEGQRRYVESVSAYAKQFLERLPRPDVDAIHGLCPALAIQPAAPARSARSTVATATEIHDYLRLLFARLGRVHCPRCGRPIAVDSPQTVAGEAESWPDGESVRVLAPVARAAGAWADQARTLVAGGFTRILLEGRAVELDPPPRVGRDAGEVLVVVDRLAWSPAERARLAESCEVAFRRGEGRLLLQRGDRAPERRSERWECAACGQPALRPEPALFSFNSPLGVCPDCRGFGNLLVFDPELVVPDPGRTLRQGAIAPWAGSWRRVYGPRLERLAREEGVPLDVPWRELDERHRRLLLHGGPSFRGAIPFLERRREKSYKAGNRFLVKRFQSTRTCATCGGRRLRAEALTVRLGGRDIAEVSAFTVELALDYLDGLRLEEREAAVAAPLLRELRGRLRYLVRVGLGYLTLDRLTRTLSSGEAQRIELANALGSSLSDVLYVLDEPTIGLHARDSRRLAAILQDLTAVGNTLVVVEHEPLLMRAADFVVDLGPGAGERGGEVLFAGAGSEVERASTATAGYLRGELRVERRRRTEPARRWIGVEGATHHNLHGLDVRFPLERLTCVTGVSGSGKSSLVEEVLCRGARRLLGEAEEEPPGAHRRITGLEHVRRVVLVDRSPIGRTPRSCPVTYVGAYGALRDAFADQWSAKARGLSSTDFSFNVPGGRCETCQGAGVVKVEMHFLADILVPCEACGGERFQRRVLGVAYRGVNIRRALDLTVDQAFAHFAAFPRFTRELHILRRVGLGYLRLGQPAHHLSGGEAQRLKIARELSERGQGPTLYVLDEPTVGLHFADVQKLLEVLDDLVSRGDTVVVVEHNLDVIRNADYVVDLGPEAGEGGGRVVAEGAPEAIARSPESWTGRFLAELLAPARRE